MTEKRVYNFSAGPSMLPVAVLEKAAKQMLNYEGSGMSVMEMSHRSSSYLDIFEKTKEKPDLFKLYNLKKHNNIHNKIIILKNIDCIIE